MDRKRRENAFVILPVHDAAPWTRSMLSAQHAEAEARDQMLLDENAEDHHG